MLSLEKWSVPTGTGTIFSTIIAVIYIQVLSSSFIFAVIRNNVIVPNLMIQGHFHFVEREDWRHVRIRVWDQVPRDGS